MNYFTALKQVTTAILLQSPALNAESNLQHDLRLCIYMHSSIACSNTHRVGNIRASVQVCMITSLEWDQMVMQAETHMGLYAVDSHKSGSSSNTVPCCRRNPQPQGLLAGSYCGFFCFPNSAPKLLNPPS